MNVLILGGTGLISTAITRELLASGVNVTHYNRGLREERFSGSVQHIVGDRRDFATFEAQIAQSGPFDCVIDMICFKPEEAHSDVRAFRGRTNHFIFCSTVDVYNRPADRYPYTESEGRIRALSEYAQNKVLAEDVFFEAHQRGDFPVTILRPAHTYGEGGTLIHSLGWSTTYLDRVRKGKPIIVHGDGSSLWSSCHIDDAAHAFVHAICNPAAYGRAYHITGEEWLTWNQYHATVAAAMGAPEPDLVHIATDFLWDVAPDRFGVVKVNFQYSNIFDNSAAKRDLDFHYTIPFLDGARRTINWLDERGLILNSDDDPFDDRLIALYQQMTETVRKAL